MCVVCAGGVTLKTILFVPSSSSSSCVKGVSKRDAMKRIKRRDREEALSYYHKVIMMRHENWGERFFQLYRFFRSVLSAHTNFMLLLFLRLCFKAKKPITDLRIKGNETFLIKVEFLIFSLILRNLLIFWTAD